MDNPCIYHNQLMQDIGEIKGTLTMLKDQQKDFIGKIDNLVTNGADQKVHMAEEHGQIEADRIKIKPFYWFLASIGAAAIIVIVDRLMSHIWPTINTVVR